MLGCFIYWLHVLMYTSWCFLLPTVQNDQNHIRWSCFKGTGLIQFTTIVSLTYSMEESPAWEANKFSTSQRTPHILWNPKVNYRIHKCLPPVFILIQLDSHHSPTSHILKIHLNIILSYMLRSPKWSFFLRFPHKNPVYALSLPLRATRPTYLILLDFITQIILGEE